MNEKSAAIKEVLSSLVSNTEKALLEKQESDLGSLWYWKWDENQSIEWNTYKFSDYLESFKWNCRRWEEHHNGSCCVVERVRDKYIMPRVKEFLSEIKKHN